MCQQSPDTILKHMEGQSTKLNTENVMLHKTEVLCNKHERDWIFAYTILFFGTGCDF
jgi:hypothetical protein